jgi:hypothetical protein
MADSSLGLLYLDTRWGNNPFTDLVGMILFQAGHCDSQVTAEGIDAPGTESQSAQ